MTFEANIVRKIRNIKNFSAPNNDGYHLIMLNTEVQDTSISINKLFNKKVYVRLLNTNTLLTMYFNFGIGIM